MEVVRLAGPGNDAVGPDEEPGDVPHLRRRCCLKAREVGGHVTERAEADQRPRSGDEVLVEAASARESEVGRAAAYERVVAAEVVAVGDPLLRGARRCRSGRG